MFTISYENRTGLLDYNFSIIKGSCSVNYCSLFLLRLANNITGPLLAIVFKLGINVVLTYKGIFEIVATLRDVKQPKTIHAPDGPQRKKRTKKLTLKETRFESVEAVKAKAMEVLNQLREADFQHGSVQGRSPRGIH
ncbi:hypothetical protein NQ318_018818 [Aromia moschata]|uniref:Uncharacterized protein n=1 Tax=Aromia moschata TaxID=1265417 RepID=A0AAV8ZG00_9CUCU|nr:hypothetical protein NQ318_018818 [Aromia moschata]